MQNRTNKNNKNILWNTCSPSTFPHVWLSQYLWVYWAPWGGGLLQIQHWKMWKSSVNGKLYRDQLSLQTAINGYMNNLLLYNVNKPPTSIQNSGFSPCLSVSVHRAGTKHGARVSCPRTPGGIMYQRGNRGDPRAQSWPNKIYRTLKQV